MSNLEAQIKEVKLELKRRKKAYRKAVDSCSGSKKKKLDTHLKKKFGALRSTLETLTELKKHKDNAQAYNIIDKDNEEVFELTFENENFSSLFLQSQPELSNLPSWSIVAQIFPMSTQDGKHILRGMFLDHFQTLGVNDNIKLLSKGIYDDCPF